MKRRQDESSLELLLDTMCNTFGGVMFIAISLVVIISMTGSLRQKHTPEDDSLQSVEQLTAAIEAMKITLAEVTARQTELQQQTATMSSDPRLKQLAELAALEDTARTLELQVSLEQQALNAETVKLSAQQSQCQQATADANRLDAELAALQQNCQNLAILIATLQNEQQKMGLKMAFTTLIEKKEMPYFIALKNDQAWRIGPDDDTRLTEANDDVTSTVKPGSPESHVTCVPRPDAGVPILSSDHISPQLQRILSAIPHGRVPCFLISPGSAQPFYVLREQLKKAKLFHGFRLQTSDDSFTYQVTTEKSRYEY